MESTTLEKVFVTGYSVRAPNASSVAEFYENLKMERDMTSVAERYPAGYLGLPPRQGALKQIDRFDQQFFNFSSKQVDKMDVAIRLLLEVTQEALMDAKLPISQLKGSQTGVYVGHCFSDYLNRATNDPNLTGYELVNGAHTMAANKISYHYDLRGPSLAVDTACSSSLVALEQAVADLQRGVIKRAIVGGLSLTLDPKKNATFNAFTMLSPDGRCYSFDERANGYCRAEGVAVVVLELGETCRQSGYAEVLGCGVNNDGWKSEGITYPSGERQAANALSVIERCSIDPNSIRFVEAHGTGTKGGDHQELQGLSKLFYGTEVLATKQEADAAGAFKGSAREILLGSVKSCMGHAEGASGLMSLIKCLLMYEKKQLLPNLNFQTTSHQPLLDGRFKVCSQGGDWDCGNVCISNYGFGGTNAFCVLGPANVTFKMGLDQPPFKLDVCRNFANRGEQGEASAASTAFFQMQALLGNDKPYSFRNGAKVQSTSVESLCFVYGGQGSQWKQMGKGLLAENPDFRVTIERLDGYLQKHMAREQVPAQERVDLMALFEDGERWMDRDVTALGIVCYQIAATNLLRESGVRADFYCGHSLGEVAAGYGCGMQTEEETVAIAYERARLSTKVIPGRLLLRLPHTTYQRWSGDSGSVDGLELLIRNDEFSFWYVSADRAEALMAQVRACVSLGSEAELAEVALFDLTGRMAAVALPVDVLEQAISALGLKETVVACRNSPAGQTVSGSAVEVAQLKQCLEQQVENLQWRDLNTDQVAYHAPHLACYKQYLVQQFARLLGSERSQPRTLDPRWLTTSQGEMYSAEYHANNIVRPVFFQDAIERLPPNTVVVEVGSARSMLSHVKRVRQDVVCLGLVAVGKQETELESYAAANKERLLRRFWETGLPVFRDVGRVDRTARLPLEHRYHDLWNHEKKQRVFDWSNFELIEQKSVVGVSNAAGTASVGCNEAHVQFDLKGKDAYLVDHRINGRPLFPATGYPVVMWDTVCSTFEKDSDAQAAGIDISDLEVLRAVVLDPDTSPLLELTVLRQDSVLTVLHDSDTVACAKYTLISGEALTTNKPLDHSGTADNLVVLDHASVYNLFGRYGYEYRTHFRLLEQLNLSARECEVKAKLRGTPHLIAHLDNILQLFLKDVDGLDLPTLIRQVRLHPQCRKEMQQHLGVPVELQCSTGIARTETVVLRSLVTTPAPPRAPQKLTHHCMRWLPVGASASSHSPLVQPQLLEELVAQELGFVAGQPGLVLLKGGSLTSEAVEQRNAFLAALSQRLGTQVEELVLEDLNAEEASVKPVHVLVVAHDCNPGKLQTRLHSTDAFVLVVSSVQAEAPAWCQDPALALQRIGSYQVGDDGFLLSVFRRQWYHQGGEVVFACDPSKWHETKHFTSPTVFCGVGMTGFLRSLRLEQDVSMVAGIAVEPQLRSGVTPLHPPSALRMSALRADASGSSAAGVWLNCELLEEAAAIQASSKVACDANFSLTIERPGDLSSLRWVQAPNGPEYDTDVVFSALNFKDVMYSFGKIQMNKPSFGLEFAGYDRVEGTERRVMGIGVSSCIARRTKAALRWDVPEDMTLEQAATVPVVYLTAAFALFEKAGLREGDSVLVHAGTGGIGHAAIHLCMKRGIKVYATCAPHKKQYLVDYFGLPEADIGSSRDTSFRELVWECTGGCGVTCVLNSLSGPLLDASLEVVADFGHFCEIGKYDLQTNTKVGLKVFEKNVSYHAIELSFMFEHPRHSKRLQAMMSDLLARGEVAPLPTHVFSAHQVTDGLRFLSSGKHRGKVLIGSMMDFATSIFRASGASSTSESSWEEVDKLAPPALSAKHTKGAGLTAAIKPLSTAAPQLCPQFRTHGRHIVTGGLGGLGLELAKWLVEHGASHVVLSSRSGELRSDWQRFRFGALQPQVSVTTVACDGSVEECKHLLSLGNPASNDSILAAPDTVEPLAGVWHAAGVLHDSLFFNMGAAQWDSVNQVKAEGVRNLDRALRDTNQNKSLFVGFSSVAALFGNAGQTNYAHANSVIDSVMNQRSQDGLPGLSVQWGAMGSVGMLAHQDLDARIPVGTMQGRSLCVQRLDDSLVALGKLLADSGMGYGTVSICRLEQDRALIAAETSSAGGTEVTPAVAQSKLAEILGGDAMDYQDMDTPLRKFGLDSLSQIELVNWINANVTTRVTPSFLTETLSLGQLLEYMKSHAAVPASAQPVPDAEDAKAATVDADRTAAVPAPSDMSHSEVLNPVTLPATAGARVADVQLQYQLNAVELTAAVAQDAAARLKNQLRTVKVPELLTNEFMSDLLEILQDIKDHWASGVLVMEGDSDKVFNHGAPIDSGVSIPEVIARYVDLSRALLDCQNAVLVVRVRGSVRGGGLLFPAVADVCVAASDNDTSFGLPEIHRQMVPGVVSAALARKIGKAQCNYYCMTGRPFSASKAVQLGLVSELLSEETPAEWQTLLRRLQTSAEQAVFMKKREVCSLGSDGEMTEPEQMGTVMGEFFANQDATEHSGSGAAFALPIDCLQLHELSLGGGDGGSVAVLTMCDQAARNTFSAKMNAQLEMVVQKVLSRLDSYRALVLTSSVQHVFHCGANPHEMRRWCSDTSLSRTELAHRMKSLYSAFLQLFSLEIPVVAVLHGKVYGGGCPLALWADYRVGTNELDLHYGNITRGMSPAAQLSELWGHYLPQSRVLEFYYENAHWDGQRCLQEGLVSSLHSTREEAVEQALRLASFVGRQAPQGVQRTRRQVRAKLRSQIIDCEAWAIACSISEKAVFTKIKSQNESFTGLSSAVRTAKLPAAPVSTTTKQPEVAASAKQPWEEDCGVVCMQLAIPARACSSQEVEANFAEAPCSSKCLQRAVGVWDCDEDSISFALTALDRLLGRLPSDFRLEEVGRLEVGTESNVDVAKSVKSYLTDLFPASHKEICGVDNLNACYGGTAALLNTLDWLRAHPEARFGIVVATDTAVMDEKDVSYQGAGAVAMLVSRESVYQQVFKKAAGTPLPVVIERSSISLMRNTQDFLKPRYASQLSPFMRGRESMEHYLEAMRYCVQRTSESFGATIGNSDYCLVHGGLCRSVATRVMNEWGKLAFGAGECVSRTDLMAKFEIGLKHGEQLGGLYTASLYFSLHSLLEHLDSNEAKKVMLFSYGSGSTATMLRARVHHKTEGFVPLQPELDARQFISASKLKQVIARHGATKTLLDADLPQEVAQRHAQLAAETEGSSKGRYVLTRFPAGNEKRVYQQL